MVRGRVGGPLWPQLLYHRLRGADPALRVDDVVATLSRLTAAGVAVNVGDGVWRLQRHLDVEAARAIRAAARAAAQDGNSSGSGAP